MDITVPGWWKSATCYQIWPASYKDSNGDGIGDIPGVISTLPYIQSLGVDVIWLSPMYTSPEKDMGYDISDYENVNPRFGTLADMDELLKQVHARGMKLILDLVINHTSDQHPWFLNSRASKTGEFADWYMWRDPKVDAQGKRHPPNNWRAIFGGSAWVYAPERDQYYLHLFAPEQPDLNWENPATRQGIYKTAIEFWLDRGVDGFRVDTVNLYSKNQTFADAPITLVGEEFQPANEFYTNGPRMHEWLQEQRRVALDKYAPRDIMMVGELPGTEGPEVLKYVSTTSRELSMVFDFDVVSLGGRGSGKKHNVWKHTLPDLKAAVQKVQDLLHGTDAWVTVFMENHDQGRSLSRFATDEPQWREKAAKMLAVLQCCQSGTLFVYQGQEIGMVNVPAEWGAEEIRDVDSLNYYNEMVERYAGDPLMMKKALAGIRGVSRDNARTPVQWDDSPNAGFSTGNPWIRVHDNYKEVNLAKQLAESDSPVKFWTKMLKLRKEHADVLIHGDFAIHDFYNLHVFTFIKTKGDKKAVVVLNWSDHEEFFEVPPAVKDAKLTLLVANVPEIGKYMTPWEARVYLVN